jgi:predicted CXXCH cytochrome family protein
MRRVVTLALLMIGLVGMIVAQPAGKIKVVGVPDKYKSANANQRTTSLKNVGKGERVVLKATAFSAPGDSRNDTIMTVTAASWAVTGPAGNTAVIADTGSTNMMYVYFVPDVVGKYTVEMTATTADAGVLPPVTIDITAGTYKGVGIYNDTTGTWRSFNCTPCHSATSGVFAEFAKTKHASVMPRRLDEVGGHFSNSCLACHTVGSLGATGTSNNNFEELRIAQGWNVPANGPGQYEDSLVATNPALAMLSGIQCENCHGPAGQHAGPGVNIDKSLSSEVCAPCHFSSDRHPKGYSWDASAHANPFAEGSEWNYMNRDGCAQCHTGNGFVANFNDIPNAVTQTYPDVQGITCAACHDPHSEANEYQLRRSSVAEACTGCHENRISSHGLHHSHQGPMIVGADAEPYGPDKPTSGVGFWSGWEFPGYAYENSSHEEIEERCAVCHMANTPTYDPTYATPDTLLNRVGGHTFAVVWDNDTPGDESDDILNYVGCEPCHGQVTIDFVRLTQEKTHKLLDTLAAYLPKDPSSGELLDFSDPSLNAIQKAAAYNYYFVENDGSFGAHNFKYAEGLLQSSIEQVKLSAGAAAIASITDVPNDQGKQVQVVWNMFPAEMLSYERAENYGVWRLDVDPGTGKVGKTASNYQEMLLAGPVGTQVKLGAFVSTFVGTVPATGLDQYSYIAPTLYDSTVSGGMAWSVFVVAGYSAGNATVYLSAPDSGYSVDNLRPVPPAGLQASVVPTGVRLSWNSPTDPDVDVYNVFRSTTGGFDPTGMTPIASVKGTEYVDVSVTAGTVYYYRIGAQDFSGNKSDFSSEVNILVTGVEEMGGTPTEFALNQNYPNPFNPTTEIRFALPSASHVRLSVYTVSGELVATLVNEEMNAGYYNVTWNGTSTGGVQVSSGLYLYRIQAGDFVQTMKMVLVK